MSSINQTSSPEAVPDEIENEEDPLDDLNSLGDDSVDGIAFEQKTVSLSEQYANYNKTVKNLSKYLKVGGMFE